jgi:predicted MFS family arabinose efflux permease
LFLVLLGGFGYVFINPSAVKALTGWFRPKMRATAIGVMKSGVNAGGALGATLLPAIALLVGWRNGLACTLLGIIVLSVLVTVIYREPPDKGAQEKVSFGVREFRQVVTNRSIVLLGSIGMAYSAIQLSTSTYLVLFLTEQMSFSVIIAGTFLTVTALSGAAGRILWGIISDRIFHGERKIVLLLVGVISGVFAIVIALSPAGVQAWLLYLIVAVFGFASFGWMGVHVTYLAELAGTDQAGTAVGFGLSITGMGILIGPPVFGYIVDVTQSYTSAWTAFGIIAAIGGVLAMTIRPPKGHQV